MTDIRGAQILPFPRPAHAAAIRNAGAPDDDAAERLRRALQALEDAVVAQRAAVAQWRGALGTLGNNLSLLHGTMQGYDATLGALRGRVDAATASARMVADWADAAVAVAHRMSHTDPR